MSKFTRFASPSEIFHVVLTKVRIIYQSVHFYRLGHCSLYDVTNKSVLTSPLSKLPLLSSSKITRISIKTATKIKYMYMYMNI